jgi:hypothetical protein
MYLKQSNKAEKGNVEVRKDDKGFNLSDWRGKGKCARARKENKAR